MYMFVCMRIKPIYYIYLYIFSYVYIKTKLVLPRHLHAYFLPTSPPMLMERVGRIFKAFPSNLHSGV